MPTVDYKVMLNGKLASGHTVKISPLNEGFFYGHGLFETIKVLAARPVFLASHHARLAASARALDLAYDLPLEKLRERLHAVIAANSLKNGSVKINLYNAGETTGELLSTRAFAYSPDTYARGFRLKTSLTGRRLSGLTAHKTANYLENIRARRAALASGHDEMLFIDTDGQVIEGAGTNFFVVKDGVAHTPPLSVGPLPGIARAQVLALLGPARAREAKVDASALRADDEVFVTNALLGVMPVARIDDREFPVLGPFTRDLQSAYAAHELKNQ